MAKGDDTQVLGCPVLERHALILCFQRDPESGLLTNPLEQTGQRGDVEMREKPWRTLTEAVQLREVGGL